MMMLSAENEKLKTLENQVLLAATALDDRLSVSKTLLGMFTSDWSVREYYSIPKADREINDEIDELNNLRKRLMLFEKYDYVHKLRIYVPETKFYRKESIQFFPLSQLEEEPVYSSISSEIAITLPYERDFLGEGKHHVISLYQSIAHKDLLSRMVGMASLDLDCSRLFELIQQYIPTIPCQILSYSDGSMIFDFGLDVSFDNSVYQSLDSERNYTFVDKGKLYMLYQFSSTDWVMISRLGNRQFIFSSTSNNTSLLMLFLALIIFIITAIFITNSVTSRISSLVQTTQRKNALERHGLFKSLDAAIIEVQDLIVKREAAIRQQEESRLRLLQAQINPHFLYNSMDLLRWMIVNNEKEHAASLVIAMSKYFRLVLSQGKDIIPLKEEVELTKLYVQLQKHCQNDSIHVEYTIQEEALPCLIPKMCLQPLVENALVHGLDYSKSGSLFIDAELTDDDDLQISVTDTGKGLDTEKIKRILEGNEQSKSFGLFNVQQRIRLFSGDEKYGITVESEDNRYSIITLLIKTKRS